ncbi:MAG: hypothetical protein GTN99_07235, partial [Candidatus Dadabacteria bacterium]|nr:hypothetical protein [Candidatus Dadabacteria bacterium]
MEVICSFCELSFKQFSQIVKRGHYAICADCVSIVKEIFTEFETSETYEGGGVCSICGKHHTHYNKVFKGKKVQICSACLQDIEDDLNEMGHSAQRDRAGANPEKQLDPTARVRPEIVELSAYSVPHYEC